MSGDSSNNQYGPVGSDVQTDEGGPEGRRPRLYYGWYLAGIVWLMYGAQAVGFYGLGFYMPEMLGELGLSRAQGGIVFGVASFAAGVVAPLIGMCIGRFGLRATMVFGFLVSAIGYYATGFVQGLTALILVYGFAHGTHAFAAVLPTQTLASTWFVRYRARVLAVLLSAAGMFSPLVYALHAWILQEHDWRLGWQVVGGINLVLGFIALAFVRDSPESVGQLPDGASSREELESLQRQTQSDDRWTAKQALRTPQFSMMVLCGLGYAVPWGVINNHGRLHLQDAGLGIDAAAAVLSTMVLVSTVGRLSGSFADFISPPRLLSLALAFEATGVLVFLYATTSTTATVGAGLIGLGFGIAFISQAATFAHFFGRRAFATTTGVRFMIGAIFGAFVPGLVGWVFDVRGTYAPAFIALAVVTYIGSLTALVIQKPTAPAGDESEAVETIV